MATRDFDPRRASVAVGADDHKRRGLLPLLLGLLLLLLVAGLLVLLLTGGDDDSSSKSGSGGSGGTLTAGSTTLLGKGADLKSRVGEDATGTGVKVLSVTPGGFFVGTSPVNREFVEYGGTVGTKEAGAKEPKVGDLVDLTGPVRPSPEDPAKALKLSASDAAVVKARGGFINADKVTPRG